MTQDKETLDNYYRRKSAELRSQNKGARMRCRRCDLSGVAGEDLEFGLNVTFMPDGVIETEMAQCINEQLCTERVQLRTQMPLD